MEILNRKLENVVNCNYKLNELVFDSLNKNTARLEITMHKISDANLFKEGYFCTFNDFNNKEQIGLITKIDPVSEKVYKLETSLNGHALQTKGYINAGITQNLGKSTKDFLDDNIGVNALDGLPLTVISNTINKELLLFAPQNIIDTSTLITQMDRLYNIQTKVTLQKNRLYSIIEDFTIKDLVLDTSETDIVANYDILFTSETYQMVRVVVNDTGFYDYYLKSDRTITNDPNDPLRVPITNRTIERIDNVSVSTEDIEIKASEALAFQYENEIEVEVTSKFFEQYKEFDMLNQRINFIYHLDYGIINEMKTIVSKISTTNGRCWNVTLGLARTRLTDKLKMKGVL
ncbi:MAG: hypothetical protein ACRCZK_01730 [Oscillospiraceae bacterium]